MNTTEAAKNLSEIDAPDKWLEHCPQLRTEDKAKTFKLAEQMWVERMVKSNSLLVHPDILKQLEKQSWAATDIQKRMIWASVLATAEGSDSKERFKNIKILLLKKHGRDWWEDVYKRVNNAWAAKERIRKRTGSDSPAISMMANNTILFAGAAQQERESALRMIPST